MRPRAALVVVLAALVLASCDSDRRALSRDDLPEIPDDPTVVVELSDDGFDPDDLEITTDDLVEFRIVGEGEHGVRTSDHRIDTGPLFPGETTEVLFDEPGSYEVVDTADDEATMHIVVDEGGRS